MTEKKAELQRGLEARHIELIALGGTIGVGFIYGSGKYAEVGRSVGPVGVYYRRAFCLLYHAFDG